MTREKYLSHYSIENIAQSIARDSEAGKNYTGEDKRGLYHKRLLLVGSCVKLHEIHTLDHIHSYDLAWVKE